MINIIVIVKKQGLIFALSVGRDSIDMALDTLKTINNLEKNRDALKGSLLRPSITLWF